MKKLYQSFLLLTLALASLSANAFVVSDIRVDGLQRISAGTVFNYLPIGVGAEVNASRYPEIIRALYKTGFFTDVQLEQEGNVLVIAVVERPAIAEINYEGNKDISKENLNEALKQVGLEEGRVFDRALLEKVEQELLRQYYSRGKYAVRIESDVTGLPRNRVAITLNISEGKVAKIRQIKIVGNEAFTDKKLLKQFNLSTPKLFSFFSRADRYSKQQLAADLETLSTYYLDRGYLKFNIESTQVTITPDKKDIYLTVNITEGDQYTLSKIDVGGETVVDREEILALVDIEEGEVFNRTRLAEVADRIGNRVGDEGYAFNNVNPVPELNEEDKTVAVNFLIDPGRRVYVRRINFAGNTKTHDEAIRREMRQIEGSWFSNKDVKRSTERLERLRYLTGVSYETEPVPGTNDQIDLNYTIVERPSGNLSAGVGYGQESGVQLSAGVSQENFLGTGNRFSFGFDNSNTTTEYSIAFNDPFYTVDGISRGFDLYYREEDAGEENLADYVTDEYGALIKFGIPLNETETIQIGGGYSGIQLKPTEDSPQEVADFIDERGEDTYHNFVLQGSWANDTRNKSLFPTKGGLNRIALEATIPGSDLEYYKASFRHRSYYALGQSLTFSARTDIGIGDGHGDLDQLPFFENYFAGGLRTVRGFKANTLGPRFSNDEPSGGAARLTAGAELIFPTPFFTESEKVRLAAFADVGNVFATASDFKSDELRYSAGISLLWVTPIGPLSLSYGIPLNDEEEDEVENFQFALGASF